MARSLVAFAALLFVASTALLPLGAARADPTMATCGYHKGAAAECESFCILGLWISKDGGRTHQEICVVPNCACYPGAALRVREGELPIALQA